MLKPGIRVFFQRPEEFSARVLHAASVLSVDEAVCAAALDEPLALELDQSLLIYYEINREFVQQPARITIAPREEAVETFLDPNVDPAPPDPEQDPPNRIRVDFETTGFVLSAESRECYRVTTLSADLTVRLGKEESCPLVDVSASGFSVIAGAVHGRGDVLPATLQYEDKVYMGKASVQSIKTLVTGETRYGLSGVETGRGTIQQGQGAHHDGDPAGAASTTARRSLGPV